MENNALILYVRLLWLLLGLLWISAEAVLARRMPPAADYRERQSEFVLRGVAASCLILALLLKMQMWLPLPLTYLPRQIAALLMFAAALGLRFYAVCVLGHFFTTQVVLHADHRLIVHGPYRHIRHPAYTGLLLAFAAAGIAMGDALALLAMTVPLCYAVKARIAVEESMLRQRFGKTYEAYCQTTKKLLPRLY